MSQLDLYRPPAEEYNQWHIDQIYTGDENYISRNRGGVVPNPGDTVIGYVGFDVDSGDLMGDIGQYNLSVVYSVDPMTELSTLVPMVEARSNFEAQATKLYAGSGAGRVMDADRIYLNEKNARLPFEVDGRIRGYGSDVSYFKIFLDSDIHDTGTVISVRYDADGNPVGDRIGLELVDDTLPEKAIFRPVRGNLNRKLKEGDRPTLVAYKDSGAVSFWQPLVVHYGAMVADVNAYTNYITGIHLESPYLVAGADNELEIPMNFLNSSLITHAYVNYKDGTKRRVEIGTEGMHLRGWNQFAGGHTAGQVRDLVLTYELGPGETAPLVEGGETPHLAQAYKVTVVASNKLHAVKLFADLIYIGEEEGYQIRYWLMNLERSYYLDVTDQVTIGSGGTGPFQPKAYGVKQTMALRLDLSKVDPAFEQYVYTQAFDVTLVQNPSRSATPYLLDYIPGSSRPFGAGLEFTYRKDTDDSLYLTLDSGISQQLDWMEQFYYRLHPLFDKGVETTPPAATHVRITYNNESFVVDVNDYDVEVDITEHGEPVEGQAFFLEWFKLGSDSSEQMLARSVIYGFKV